MSFPLTHNRMCMSSEITVFPSSPFWLLQTWAVAMAVPLHTMWPAARKSFQWGPLSIGSTLAWQHSPQISAGKVHNWGTSQCLLSEIRHHLHTEAMLPTVCSQPEFPAGTLRQGHSRKIGNSSDRHQWIPNGLTLFHPTSFLLSFTQVRPVL